MNYKTENNLIIIEGVSGVGKSTRVYQFLKFCEDSLKWDIETYYYNNIKMGKIIKPLNLLIMGKTVIPDKETKKERWQGFDRFTSKFEGSEGVSKWMEKISLEYSLLLEGASTLDSFRFRPLYFEKELGIKNYKVFVYFYPLNALEDYKNRIIERSGHPPRTGTMWKKNKGSFMPTQRKSDNETKKLGLNPEDFNKNIFMINWDVPVTQLGIEILTMFDRKELIPQFISWSKENNYTKIFKWVPKEKKKTGSIFGK